MSQSSVPRTPFRLGEWIVEPELNRVRNAGSPSSAVIELEPKIMEVLCALAAQPNEVLSREQLLQQVWPGRVVVEEALSRCISRLRETFGDDVAQPRYIQTIRKRGYRLLIQPAPLDAPAAASRSYVIDAPAAHAPDAPPRRLKWMLAAMLALTAVGLVTAWPPRKDEAESSLAAERLYVEGRNLWERRSAASLDAAVERFEAAIALKPDYAQAYVALAQAHLLRSYFSSQPPHVVMPLARSAAEQALALDDSIGAAHAVLAVSRHQYEWDWDGAEAEFRRAIELDPKDATTRQWYGELLQWRGRFDEARAQFRTAFELEPSSLTIHTSLAGPDLWSGDYAAAQQILLQVLERDPNFTYAISNLGLALLFQGDADGALRQFERAQEMFGEDSVYASLAHAYGQTGRVESARGALARLRQQSQSGRYIAPFRFALIHMGLGESDAALDWLARGVVARDDHLVGLALEPRFAPLREHPRFQTILDRIGLDDVEQRANTSAAAAVRPGAALARLAATTEP